jgi:hypothetical protein
MRTRPHRGAGRAVATTLTAVLVLAGCGGGSDEASDSGTPEQTTSSAAASESTSDAGTEAGGEVPELCSLVTAEDFRTVLGEPTVGDPESTPATGAMRGMCTWTGEVGFPALLVSAYDAADRETTLEMVDATPVEGLGAEAHWADSTGLLIAVEGADWYLQVYVAGADDDQAASEDFARIVLANLET